MRTGDHVLAMVNDLHVIFGKGPGGLAVPNDAEGHAPMFNRRDARDEEPLCEPPRLLGRVWEDKRYTCGTGGPVTFARKRRHASKAV